MLQSSSKGALSFTCDRRRVSDPIHGSSDPHRQERMKAHLEMHEIHEGPLVENRCHVRDALKEALQCEYASAQRLQERFLFDGRLWEAPGHIILYDRFQQSVM